MVKIKHKSNAGAPEYILIYPYYHLPLQKEKPA